MPFQRLITLLAIACASLPAAAVRADNIPVANSLSDSDDIVDSLSGSGGKAALVAFDSAPFPYDGAIPPDDTDGPDTDVDTPFLDAHDGDRRGHTSPRGGVYWEDQTYSDRRSLLYIPPGFDRRRPAAIVVYFHGNQAMLGRDVVDRQQVPRQLAESGLNAVLVAPQLAVDALDSSAGGFWRPGAFARYLREAAAKLAKLDGQGATAEQFARMPVIMVAYSGGYLPAAWSAELGGAGKRLKGLILLDAVYDETDKFADWIGDHQGSAFFFSAFTASSAQGNGALQDLLMNQGVEFKNDPPGCLKNGDVVFLDTGEGPVHNDFVSHAWTDDPLTWLFDRISGYPRPGQTGDAGAADPGTCKR
ncbi:MAG TPA: alpha/beta hydrolase [Candidatus Binatia bacterium]|nr:alpha/beta hydrolase [Candidatus Binatia bacterium]